MRDEDRNAAPNVAIFASAFHPSLGGVEELCRQLAHEYQHRGWNVCVLSNRWPRSLPAFERFEGIPVYRLPFRTPGAGLKSEFTFRLTSRLVEKQVGEILRRQGANLVHIQCVGCNAHYARRVAEALELPLVVSLQGELTMDATHLFERCAFARETMRKTLLASDFITACSEQTLDEAKHFLGTPFAAPSRVIHNGIRLADFTGAPAVLPDRRYVLGIGRHVPQKGFDVLIRAMALLWGEGQQDLDLILAGDGPERIALEKLATELGIRDRVIFPGRADRATAGVLFAGCELFVLPSRHEPFGIVNLEAMACGRPVVATRTGGVPEIVQHGITGWLVSPDSPTALAHGMAHLLNNDGLAETLASNGRRLAALYDWSKIGDEYGSVYQSVIHRGVENPIVRA